MTFENYALARVAGLPIATIDRLAAPRSYRLARAIIDRDASLRADGTDLADRISALVPGCLNDRARRGLLQLRRDVYNLRASRVTVDPVLASLMGEELVVQLESWISQARFRETLMHEGRRTLADELIDARAHLGELFSGGWFVNAIALTNPALQKVVEETDWRRCGAANKKERRNESTLLRCICRATTRTTPLSHFATIALVELVDAGAGRLSVRSIERRSRIDVNRCILLQLVSSVEGLPSVRAHLPVTLNPTLRKVGSTWRWLMNRVKSIDENWFMQRFTLTSAELPAKPALNRLLERLGNHEGRPLRTVLEALSGVGGQRGQQLSASLAKLIDLDLLQVHAPIAEMEQDHLSKFVQWLRSLDAADEDLAAASGAMERISEFLDVASNAHSMERSTALEAIHSELELACRALKLPSVPKRRAMLFENVLATDRILALPRAAMVVSLRERRLVGKLTALFDLSAFVRFAAVDYFLTACATGETVPFLDFFSGFIRWLGDRLDGLVGQEIQADTSVWSRLGVNLSNSADLAALSRAQGRVQDLLSEEVARSGGEVVSIPLDALELLLGDIEGLLPLRGALSLYVVPVMTVGSDTPALHLTQVLTGCTKGYSRYVSLFGLGSIDDGTTGARLEQLLRSWLEDLQRRDADGVFLDVAACLGSNGSVRPPLTQLSIEYPGANAGDRRTVSLSDLEVSCDVSRKRLVIHCKQAGGPVVPLDLGQTHITALPALYQILVQACGVPAQPFCSALLDGIKWASKSGFDFVPELRLGRYVLAPRRWSVPVQGFPAACAFRDEFDFLMAVENWRSTVGLPQQVTCQPATELDVIARYRQHLMSPATGATNEPWHESGSTATQKFPIVVDFNSPILISLVVGMIAKGAKRLIFEDVLPTCDSCMVQVDGNPHRTEFLLELPIDSSDD